MIYEDFDLIQQSLDGDQQAFATLVEKYQKQIHALAWQKIGDFHIAQEITQDAFLTAYQKLSTLTNPNRFAGWLYVIANRKCIAWHRKKSPQPQSLETTDPVELEEVYYSEYMTQQREEAANQKRRAVVQKLLSKLQESERTVVNMYYIAEMTCEDIGKFLGVSSSTVRSRLHRARIRLKKEEAMIKENLSSFHLPTQMTENIMKGISRLNPVAPSGSKPLVPLAISAVSAIIVLLLIGVGAQNLIRFQKPYSIEAKSEQTIEIVDTRIVLESPFKPAVSNQVSRSDVLSNNDGIGQKPDTPLFAAAQSDDAEISTSKAQWGQTNGPYGGDILALYASPNGVLLVGTERAGIFRSTDRGATWTSVNTGLPFEPRYGFMSVISLVQKYDTLYAGTVNTLYASNDGGNTWRHVSNFPRSESISSIVLIGERIYIGTLNTGVWYSDDGDSWLQVNHGFGPMLVSELSVIGTTLVAATDRGVFRKRANEDSWVPINTDFRVNSFAAMENMLYAAGYTDNTRLLRSDDEGNSWIPVATKEMTHTVEAMTVYGATLYAGTSGGGVFRSDDNGDSWIVVNDGLTHETVSTLLAVNEDTVFVGTSGNGVFRTMDGGNSWVEINTGITNATVDELEVIGDKIYTQIGQTIVHSVDGGESWQPVNNPSIPIKYESRTLSVSSGELYVGAWRLFPRNHSEDIGYIFKLDEENNALVELIAHKNFAGIPCMDVVDNTFYIGTLESGVFQWDKDSGPWTTNLGLENHYISVLSANSESVIAVTGDSEIYRFKENRWEPIHSTDMIDDHLSDLKWVGSTLYATFWKNGVFRSRDGGDSWISINDGLDEMSATSIGTDGTKVFVSALGTDGTEVYVSAFNGVFQWMEDKKQWKLVGTLPYQVLSIAVLDDFLYAGPGGGGIYKIQIEK